MNNLFNLTLTLLTGVTCIQALTAETTEVFVLASLGMFLSLVMFLVNIKHPLFKKK
jgi:hypothetical protein